jgi:hypothetical protein
MAPEQRFGFSWMLNVNVSSWLPQLTATSKTDQGMKCDAIL